MRLPVMLAAVACALPSSGCLSDCSVGEASGLLSTFSVGCSGSAHFDENGRLTVQIDPYAYSNAENLYTVIEFSAAGPFYVGRRLSAEVTVGPRANVFLESSPAAGQVDFILDGADYSKSYEKRLKFTIVDLTVRDRVTSQVGRFRGSLNVLQTGSTP
jgi:hypothetical protein